VAIPELPADLLRACVVGSVNVDLFLVVEELPARGETVLGRGTARAIGGKGANQAVALARLGGSVALVGAVGDDDDGRAAAAAIGAAGVDLGGLRRVSRQPTGMAAITVDAKGENTIVVTAGANAACTRTVVREEAARIERANLVVAQLEVPIEAVVEAFRIAATAPTKPLRVLNAAPARELPAELLELVDVLVVNQVEASLLAGGRRGAEDAARALLDRGPTVVAVTLGARGSLALGDGGGVRRATALPVSPVDTTGAGDAFVACFALLQAAGTPLDASLRAANAAAALSTLVPGAQAGLPTWAQVQAALRSQG
jgi:ribokinase